MYNLQTIKCITEGDAQSGRIKVGFIFHVKCLFAFNLDGLTRLGSISNSTGQIFASVEFQMYP